MTVMNGFEMQNLSVISNQITGLYQRRSYAGMTAPTLDIYIPMFYPESAYV